MPNIGQHRITSPDKLVSQQIDELQRLSDEERDRRLGPGWHREMRDFYNLLTTQSSILAPSYRPRISIPQLQTLVLNEATDLTSDPPKVYILKGGRRDEPREKSFQANWRQGMYNMALLKTIIWSMLANVGWVQIGVAPTARGGRGRVWVENRDPETVHPDPAAETDADWQYVTLDDYMYIDEVRRLWPEKGYLVEARYGTINEGETAEGWGSLPSMPPGPMSIGSEMPPQRIYNSTRVKVRHLFIFDNAIEAVEKAAGSEAAARLELVVAPKERYKYPQGRWITECEGIVLADGANWCPKLPDDERGTFPLVRVSALPALSSIYGPPPIRFSRGLQELGERLYSQIYENFIRLNNGVWFIHEDTGIDIDAFGGMPGEVQIIHQGSQTPTMVSPQSFNKEHLTAVNQLFMLQKELQGFTPTRQGQPAAGNVSADLFDASLFQAQYLTRLRARLLAASVQRIAQVVFYCMVRFMRMDQEFFVPTGKTIQSHKWTPAGGLDEYEVALDPASINAVSGAALRTLVIGLAKAGQIPNKYLLEALDIPGADEISEEQTRQMELAALAKLKRPR